MNRKHNFNTYKRLFTVQAIAVKTATIMWPLNTRSLQPPSAFFNKVYQVDPSDGDGRRKSTKKLIDPQSGR